MWGHGGISGYATETINLESIWPKRIINHLGMQIDPTVVAQKFQCQKSR